MFIKYIDSRAFDIDTQEIQKEIYVFFKHLGEIVKIALTRRKVSNAYNGYGDYPA